MVRPQAGGRRLLITEKNVVALFRRARPTQAILPLLAEHKITLIGPSTGAMARKPVNPGVQRAPLPARPNGPCSTSADRH
jgi:hypothetical protein